MLSCCPSVRVCIALWQDEKWTRLFAALSVRLIPAGGYNPWGGRARAPRIAFCAFVPKSDIQLRAFADSRRRRADGERVHMERVGFAVIERIQNRSVALQHKRSRGLAERGHGFGVFVDACDVCGFMVAYDEDFVGREFKRLDFCGSAHVRCFSEQAFVQNERVRAAVIKFDKVVLRRIFSIRDKEKFAYNDVVCSRGTLHGRELERNLQIHVLCNFDCKGDLAAERFNLKVRNRGRFVKREVVFHAENRLAAFVLHRNRDVVFAVELEVVAGEGDVFGIEHHGVGERFAIAGERHVAFGDARRIAKADGNLHIDEPDQGMQGNLQVHGGARFERGGDFALLHQGSVCVELRVEHPFVAREKVEVERLLFDGMHQVERVRSVAVQHKAVEQRSFGVVQAERHVCSSSHRNRRRGCIGVGVVAAVPKRKGGEDSCCAKASVFFVFRTHKTSCF